MEHQLLIPKRFEDEFHSTSRIKELLTYTEEIATSIKDALLFNTREQSPHTPPTSFPQTLRETPPYHLPEKRLHTSFLLETCAHELNLSISSTMEGLAIMKTVRDDLIELLGNTAKVLGTMYEEVSYLHPLGQEIHLSKNLPKKENEMRRILQYALYDLHRESALALPNPEDYKEQGTSRHHVLPKQFGGRLISSAKIIRGAHTEFHNFANPKTKEEEERSNLEKELLEKKEDQKLLEAFTQKQISLVNTYFENSKSAPEHFDGLWKNVLSALIYHIVLYGESLEDIKREEYPYYFEILQNINPKKFHSLTEIEKKVIPFYPPFALSTHGQARISPHTSH